MWWKIVPVMSEIPASLTGVGSWGTKGTDRRTFLFEPIALDGLLECGGEGCVHRGLVYSVHSNLYEGSGLLLDFGMERDYCYFCPTLVCFLLI